MTEVSDRTKELVAALARQRSTETVVLRVRPPRQSPVLYWGVWAVVACLAVVFVVLAWQTIPRAGRPSSAQVGVRAADFESAEANAK